MRNSKILIADNSLMSARMLEIMLKILGCKVAGICKNGIEAIDFLNKMPQGEMLDAVLLELSLEDEHKTLEIAEYIDERFGATVVFINDFEKNFMLNNPNSDNDLTYIAKPYDIYQIQQAIELALNKSKGMKIAN